MNLIQDYEMDIDVPFAEVRERAQERRRFANQLAAERVASLDVDPRGIVFRCTVSGIYRSEFPGAIEENDYFLARVENPSQLPQRIRSLYGLEGENSTAISEIVGPFSAECYEFEAAAIEYADQQEEAFIQNNGRPLPANLWLRSVGDFILGAEFAAAIAQQGAYDA